MTDRQVYQAICGISSPTRNRGVMDIKLPNPKDRLAYILSRLREIVDRPTYEGRDICHMLEQAGWSVIITPRARSPR